MLALGVDCIGSPKDHEGFLRIGKAIPILAHHASFLGHCLLAFSFFRPTGLSQETLEELTILVEVLDRVSMVGAWAIHELVEVVRQALLGLLAHMISCGDQHGVGQSTLILYVLLAPLHGGALILVLALSLALFSAFVEDYFDRLLTGGVVHGYVEQVMGGSRL